MDHPSLLITPGEPAGVGPELLAKIAQTAFDAKIITIGDPELIQARAESIGQKLTLNTIQAPESAIYQSGLINVIPVPLAQPSTAGTLAQENAPYVLQTLELAADLCLSKRVDGLVTGPVQKSIINDAGFAFTGHTEFFAAHSHTPKVVMMLAAEELRVALVTTHLPLREVSDAITQEELKTTIDILIEELTYTFGISAPRILVAGLNPHAGEGGHLGHEEIDVINPVLSQYQSSHSKLIGPLPADTLFTPHYLDNADAVLAMYHDQGLPVLKHVGFGHAVNITLGLPYIRTSVDHGTALDLAGTGQANPGSLIAAIKMAATMARKKQHRPM